MLLPGPVNPKQFDELLSDLNAQRSLHGLRVHARDLLGSNAAGMDLTPWAGDYVACLRRLVDLWLATGIRHGTNTPSSRHPTPAIDEIVEGLIQGSKVSPVRLRDGYALLINNPHMGARGFKPGPGLPRAAAGKAFLALLLSDWRLKIARCVNPRCGFYFRLGKWDHRYERGTRCPGCREAAAAGASQRRVEANRVKGKQAIHAFVAERFARRVKPGRPWYRDDDLKAAIAGAVNARFESDALFGSLYPNGITGKWVEAGRNGRKNWLLVEWSK